MINIPSAPRTGVPIVFLLLLQFIQYPYTNSFSASSINSSSESGYCDKMRALSKIIPRQPAHWVGDGFNVYPVFGQHAFTEALSPWLMFDYAAPKHFPPSRSKRGVGQHPHRGFETITIAFQGEVEHGDSVGNRDVIGPQDVQWMTAGRGIVHEEFHSRDFAKTGGTFEMCQLWLNLPKKNKMTKPRYQPILDKNIPVEEVAEGVKARVIAGTVGETKGPAKTFSPVELWDISVEKKGTTVELDVPEEHNVILFVRKGQITVGESEVGPQSVAIMEQRGGKVAFTAEEKNSQILLLGGEPLNEPIAARGPFVMNTNEELRQAMFDYQNGKLGR
eukprot:CAMPEP_0185741418 /NCGR_PEP_ID=MMETSP1171-20130828/38949_1 /TAXON_ID=374046 /ORGANISM="Helicotheca tamensis, Strain CCMP826" /LENGTH=332 /DNA_ID=CAMNT_0028413387 /DNA_START=665 /DNA_END=1663 /DNA_ORIENTATION=+